MSHWRQKESLRSDEERNTIFQENYRLCCHLADKAILRYGCIAGRVDRDDVINEMALIMLRAIELFDEKSGNKLSTYIYSCSIALHRELPRLTEGILPPRGSAGSQVYGESSVFPKAHPYGIDVAVLMETHPHTISADPVSETADLSTIWDLVEAVLPPRDVRILKLKFKSNKTLAQIGSEIGLSRERVRQLLQRSLDVLKSSESIQLLDRG